MKKLLRIISLLCFVLIVCASSLYAQEYTYKYEIKKGEIKKIKLENVFAKITVEGQPVDQMKITATGLKPPPPKAEGLRALKRTGIDNTGIGLSISQVDDLLLISGGSYDLKISYNFIIPENINLEINNPISLFEKDLEISNISGEIEIYKRLGNLKLTGITGPVVARLDNGIVNIEFSDLNQSGPMSIINFTGDIDITFPQSAKASFKLNANNGEIYTDLDIKQKLPEKKQKEDKKQNFLLVRPDNLELNNYLGATYRSMDSIITLPSGIDFLGSRYLDYLSPNDIIGSMNGGGVEITIRSSMGNLYLRKAK
jgi:lia operon protein LiaG